MMQQVKSTDTRLPQKGFFFFCLAMTFLVLACGNENRNVSPGQNSKDSIADLTSVCNLQIANNADSIKLQKMSGSGIEMNPTRVQLHRGQFPSIEYPNLKSSADSALYIASVLLNSKGFTDSLAKLDFTCRNYKYFCKQQCIDCNHRFKGTVVLDSAYRTRDVTIDLYLNKCYNEYGHAAKNVLRITSCYPKIRGDAKWLPYSYSYAYHIAHEYMHIVGFFHTDHRDDVAERVGLIGYYFINRWYKNGKNPMDVKL
jgi:hypothetical protein